MSSPTTRTLARLRKHGWTAAVTGHWNPWAHIRQDLYGIIDVLAFKGRLMIAVQATSDSNHAARVRKCREWEHLQEWATPIRRLEVWSWRKKKNGRWTFRRQRME